MTLMMRLQDAGLPTPSPEGGILGTACAERPRRVDYLPGNGGHAQPGGMVPP
jgi:hypothetical protein